MMPAAIVQNATLLEERTLVTRLAELPKAVDQSGLDSPAVIIVGRVIEDSQAMRETTAFFSSTGRLP